MPTKISLTIEKPEKPQTPPKNAIEEMKFGDWALGTRVDDPNDTALIFHGQKEAYFFRDNDSVTWMSLEPLSRLHTRYFATELLPAGTSIKITTRNI